MDGFKDSTKMKYMMGGEVSAYKTGGTVKKAMGGACGPMKKATGGTVKKAMGGACAPVKKMRGGMMDEGVSSRPTTASGRRMTNEELGMTPGGVDPAKKMPKGMGAMSDRDMRRMKAGADLTDREVEMLRKKTGMGAMSDRDMERAKKKTMPQVMSDLERARMMVTRPLARKEGGGVPSYSGKPMIRRSKGGLSAMPKGKC